MKSSSPFLDYALPAERIAQRPIGRGEARSQSKLLRARFDRSEPHSLTIEDCRFSELADILQPGDLLVLNDSAVVPSRFFVRLPDRDREVEVLLTAKRSQSEFEEKWEALARPMRALKPGVEFTLADGLSARCTGRNDDGNRVLLEVSADPENGITVNKRLESLGLMPIPPYIRGGMADEEDRETYQTVVAANPGSVACPTAGLHFSEPLLAQLRSRGVRTATITLHVGTASFTPIRDAVIAEHQMTEESYALSEQTVQELHSAKCEGRRVVVVGTTCVRTLESAARRPEYRLITGAADSEADRQARNGQFFSTDLFITPGFSFEVVDCLITNFHQPCSTHLLLVGAFAGSELVEKMYHHALGAEYRFLSYGDSMLLEPQGAEGRQTEGED